MDPYAEYMQRQANGYYNNLAPAPNPQNQMQPQPQLNPNARPTQTQVPMMVGRFVQKEDDIMPSEVPMDGRIAVFPLQDLSEVYLKQWNKYGTIDTVMYLADKKEEVPAVDPIQELRTDIFERLDRLETKLMNRQKNFKQGPKEDGSNGHKGNGPKYVDEQPKAGE